MESLDIRKLIGLGIKPLKKEKIEYLKQQLVKRRKLISYFFTIFMLIIIIISSMIIYSNSKSALVKGIAELNIVRRYINDNILLLLISIIFAIIAPFIPYIIFYVGAIIDDFKDILKIISYPGIFLGLISSFVLYLDDMVLFAMGWFFIILIPTFFVNVVFSEIKENLGRLTPIEDDKYKKIQSWIDDPKIEKYRNSIEQEDRKIIYSEYKLMERRYEGNDQD